MEPTVLVVNADDFGISPPVSDEIDRCFGAGRISSTSVIANSAHLEHACELARTHGYTDRIGVHLNLTYGPPLSSEMRAICGEGMALRERWVYASRQLRNAVYAETRAQIERVQAEGISPTHLDSHQHIINGLPYAGAAVRAARELGIGRVRLARNAFYKGSRAKALLKWAYNEYLRLAGMRSVRTFTDIKPCFSQWRAGKLTLPGPIELMCHPAAPIADESLGYPTEVDLILSAEFGTFLRQFRLATYSEIT